MFLKAVAFCALFLSNVLFSEAIKLLLSLMADVAKLGYKPELLEEILKILIARLCFWNI